MEDKRMNGGYEIIHAIKITPKVEIVVGENLKNPVTPYVVWTCFRGTDYQWGHYCTNYMKALADFGNGLQTKAQEREATLNSKGCKDNRKPFFLQDDCIPESHQADYLGQIIIVDPAYLAIEYRHPSQQLFLATYGNGCTYGAHGQAVFATSLADGESIHFERHQILGILDPEKMPSWARKSIAKLHRLEKERTPEEPQL